MAFKFSNLSLGQLRTELRRRNAKLSGRKKELIERLDAYERNQNFQQHDDILPEFSMALPKPTVYKDVNSDMKLSSVTTEKAREYLGRYNVEFDQKVVDLYEEKFLLYLRAYTTDTMDFFRSACRAEMRKKITYTVDVSILKNGYIHETQCECGAGNGPFGHCEHIRTVLYACCKFLKCGECKVEVSCLEKLQSFHKAKKHTGSPLKARDLNVECADIYDIKDFDPRPLKFRNQENYKDHFQNTCLNFKGISRTPIFQTFKPANMRAYAGDHDYFECTHEENFLRALHLSQISRKDVEKIETCNARTKPK